MYVKSKHLQLLSYISCLYICYSLRFYALNHTFMTFGDRLASVRKKKKLSQADVGKLVGINGDAYGRYERNEVKPTIQMATSIANALNISLDYLVGKTNMELDANMLKRVEAVSNLPQKEKETVFILLDSFIDRMKLQGVL